MSVNKLLLLRHDGGWERDYQAASCAASAVSQEIDVDVVLFFGALRRWVLEDSDRFDDAGREALALAIGSRPVSSIWADARSTGRLRLFACSASIALEELDVEQVSPRVDQILGWPTVIRLMGQADQVLYL